MVEKKRTLRAIDLNGNPLDQFGGNEFEIWEDVNGKVHITLDKENDISSETIEQWNEGGSGVAKIEVADIMELTNEECESLSCGDIVIEKIVGEAETTYYAYFVKDRNDKNITLIDFDALRQTLGIYYYEKQENDWVFLDPVDITISTVVGNLELEGDEDNLTSIEIDGTKYKVGGSNSDTFCLFDLLPVSYDTESLSDYAQYTINWNFNLIQNLIPNNYDEFYIDLPDGSEEGTSTKFEAMIPYLDGSPFLRLSVQPKSYEDGTFVGSCMIMGEEKAVNGTWDSEAGEFPINTVGHLKNVYWPFTGNSQDSGDKSNLEVVAELRKPILKKICVFYHSNSELHYTELELSDAFISNMLSDESGEESLVTLMFRADVGPNS